MKEFYKHNKKKVITGISLLFVIIGGYWAVRYHLPKTVEVIVQLITGAKISSSSIEFTKFGKIDIKDLKLSSKGNLIIDAPKAEILYSEESLKKFRIEEIILYDGTANITREKNGDINIVAAFTGGSKNNSSDESRSKEEEVYKPGIGVPIDRITAINATTNYTDLSYSKPIKETAYNTNGYLTFSKEKGINMIFKGTNGEQGYTYALNTNEQPYDMNIKLENIAVRTDLLQYAYDGDEVNYNGGTLNLDLSISPKGMFGGADFKDVTVRYKDLDTDVKVQGGTVDFQGRSVTVKADYEVFDTKDKFLLVYDDKGELNIDFTARGVTYSQLQKYRLVEGLNLPLENIFIDDVKFNLNLNTEREFSVNIDFFSKNFMIENFDLKNIAGKFVYDKIGLHIKDLNFSTAMLNDKKEELFKKDVKAGFDYIGTEGSLSFDIKGEESINNYIPDIKGVFNFDTAEEDFKFNFLTNIIKVRGTYFSKLNKLLLYRDGKYSIEYDLKNKKIEKGSGVIDFDIYNLKFALDFLAENNKLSIKKLTAHDKKENDITLSLTGDIELDKMKYSINFNAENFKVERNIMDNNIALDTSITGNVEGERNKTNLNLDIKDLSFKYLGEINNLNGKLELKKDDKLSMDFKGELGQIKYNNYDLNGIIFNTRIRNDKFELRDFRNGIVSAEGNIDLKNLESSLDFTVKNLNFEKFNIDFPKFYVNDATGKLRGKINNPKANIKINDIEIELVKDRKAMKIHGDINYSDFKVNLNKIYLNTNVLNGSYSLKDKKYSAQLNIIEEDPSQYYPDTNLKYRVIGTLKAEGQDKKIQAILKSTIDQVYLRGTKLPNIYLEGNYNTDDITVGEIDLNKIVLSNSEFEDIITLTAGYDIQNKIIRADIDNQEVNIEKLREYTKNEELKGTLRFNGNLEGPIEEVKYNLQVNSNQLSIRNINFGNFLMKINGNLEELLLDEFSFKYLDNSFFSRGNIELESKKYRFLVNSSKINLDFLNIFLEKYGITNIEGTAAFNLDLKDDGNSGYFNLNNFGLDYKDLYIDLQDFNSIIKLDKKLLYIESFRGLLNNGETTMKGYLELPSFNDIIENPYYMEELKYDVTLDTNGVDYRYNNYFNILFDTNFNIRNNRLVGNITINKGKISDIPNNSKSVFQIIRNFLFSSSSSVVNKSEDLGRDFQINTIFERSLELDMTLRTEEVELGIQDLNAFVTDVQGYLVGGGRLSGKNGKFNFIGEVEVKNGSLAINDNTFELDRALVVFNDRNDYFPNINPTLMIDSRVRVDSDEIGMSINGEFDDLRFNITSNNGSSSGNLSSLLVGDGDEEFTDGASATLFKTVLGSQLSQTLFKPVSNLVRNTLNISKFRIRSNILTEESQNPNEESSRLRLGAVIEAEDNLYKDKLYWVARGTLLGDDSTENNNERNNGAFDEYDFSVEYRFRPGKSIGIGAGKLPRKVKSTSDENSKDSINYHIDFKFERKYDNLLDIFRKQQ